MKIVNLYGVQYLLSTTANATRVISQQIRLLFLIIFFICSNAVLAWDAGNPAAEDPLYSSTKCVNSECSGGVVKPKLGFVGKAAGWFSMSRVADCPAGYTNNGLTCGRGADSRSAPSRLADCPAGYKNIGPAGCWMDADTYSNRSSVANCPSGYTNMGADCQKGANIFDRKGMSSMRCPSGSDRRGARCYPRCKPGYTNNGEFCGRGIRTKGPAAFTCPSGYFQGVTKDRCHKQCPSGYKNMGESCSRGVSTLGLSSMSCKAGEKLESARCIPVPDVKLRGNTHLWIVNRSLDLLKKSNDPLARKAAQTMSAGTCASQWRLGLYDGDEPKYVDDPLQTKKSTAGSHFYNPTGKDYNGNSTSSVTYLIAGVDVSTGGFRGSPNLNARQSANAQIQKIPVSGPSNAGGCYELGVALHYLTDMTQPMHASGFSGVSSPQFLHPYFEAYVPSVQTRFPAVGAFQGSSVKNPDFNFDAIARKGNALAPALMKTLIKEGKQCTLDGVDLSPIPYVGYCFIKDPAVDKQIGIVLQSAYQSTASYIYSVFSSYDAATTGGGSSVPPSTNPSTPLPTPVSSNGGNSEQVCFDMIQGKVAWSQNGSKQWGPNNINALCKSTTNPQSTVDCFKRGIAAHNSWQKATQDCKAK